MRKILKGEIFNCNLGEPYGSEQGGVRPCLVIQNDIGNKYSPTTIIAVITSRTTKSKLPTHYWLSADCGLPKNSMVELEQIRTIDKSRLYQKLGCIGKQDQEEIDKRIKISLGVK